MTVVNYKLIGTNVEAAVDATEGRLVVSVSTKAPGKKSQSGKSVVIATTHGFVAVGDVRVSINVIK